MNKRLLAFVAAGMLAGPMAANATFVFSDVDVTTNSISFTINGDMTGYAAPTVATYVNQFSIVYLGDLWTGATTYTPNTWSSSVFDNESIAMNGNTGGFLLNYNYSWSKYSSSLADAAATDVRVTVTLGGDYLNPLANQGEVQFVWGNGSQDAYHTVLGSVMVDGQTSVPEPTTLALMGLGLAGLGFASRRRSIK